MSTAELGRLQWQCRRGMRELDLLLQGFLHSGFGELDDASRQAFARLLESPDQLLQAWLLGDKRPSDPQLAEVVDVIRRTPVH